MPSSPYDYDDEGSSSNDEEEIEQELAEINDLSEDEESEEDLPQSPSKRKGKRKVTEDEDGDKQGIIVQTSFDAYFTYSASKIQTSANVFTQLVLPLTPEEYAQGIKSASRHMKQPVPSLLREDQNRAWAQKWMRTRTSYTSTINP